MMNMMNKQETRNANGGSTASLVVDIVSFGTQPAWNVGQWIGGKILTKMGYTNIKYTYWK